MLLPAELMVLAGLTQARLVGPTVDAAGVPRGCTSISMRFK
jgi:hypothetical protein